MIHSSRRDRKTKAIAEALAMIPNVHPELVPRPRPVLETEEWLWESATEFCAAMDRYAERAMEIKRENRRPLGRASLPARARRQFSAAAISQLLHSALAARLAVPRRPEMIGSSNTKWRLAATVQVTPGGRSTFF